MRCLLVHIGMTCTTEVEDVHVELEVSINLYKIMFCGRRNGGIRSVECSVSILYILFMLYLDIN